MSDKAKQLIEYVCGNCGYSDEEPKMMEPSIDVLDYDSEDDDDDSYDDEDDVEPYVVGGYYFDEY